MLEVLSFLVLVGALIFVHELGHFVWAKAFGVKVLRFSLGFGPKVVGVQRGETEYVIAAFPLGGYVRMLGESPDDDLTMEEDRERAFSQQPLWQRTIIVFAGPAMNLGLPLLLFFLVFLGDRTSTPATVGRVFPDHAAHGVLEAGDRILAVDGRSVATYYQAARIIRNRAERPLEITFERDGEERTETVVPRRAQTRRELDLVEEVGRIGIWPYHPLAVIGVTSPASPAAVAGLHTFDRVVATAGRYVDTYVDLERALGRNRGSMVPVTYLRPIPIEGALGGLAELDVYEPHVAQLTPEPGPGDGLTRAGIESADLYVSHVAVGSPELRMGLRPGDRVVSVDGEEVRYWRGFVGRLGAGEHRVTWRRGDQLITRRYTLGRERTETGRIVATLGVRNWLPERPDPPVANPWLVLYAGQRALESTWEMIELTVYSVLRLLQGRLSVSTLGGPIEILALSGQAARTGPVDFLTLMAFLSVNLGLINLLPIPLLDGGHLLFFTLEAAARRPVSLRIRQYASALGLAVLVMLMVLAFKNDLERRWPDIVEALAAESTS